MLYLGYMHYSLDRALIQCYFIRGDNMISNIKYERNMKGYIITIYVKYEYQDVNSSMTLLLEINTSHLPNTGKRHLGEFTIDDIETLTNTIIHKKLTERK